MSEFQNDFNINHVKYINHDMCFKPFRPIGQLVLNNNYNISF